MKSQAQQIVEFEIESIAGSAQRLFEVLVR
jgi:hypothetical protein